MWKTLGRLSRGFLLKAWAFVEASDLSLHQTTSHALFLPFQDHRQRCFGKLTCLALDGVFERLHLGPNLLRAVAPTHTRATTMLKRPKTTVHANLNRASGAPIQRRATMKERGSLGRPIHSCATTSKATSAIARAMCPTLWASAEGHARLMQTAMAFATMSIHAWGPWTTAGFAMAQGRCTIVVAPPFLKVTAIAKARRLMPLGCAAGRVWKTRTAMGCATMWTLV